MAGQILRERPLPGVLRLAMSQPEKRNAMDYAMREGLRTALAEARDDRTVDAVVLTGDGDTYSAGGDLDGIAAIPPDSFRAYLNAGHDLVRLLDRFAKPVVAAIAGVGVGGGFALALTADLIVMSRGAKVGLPFLKIGFVPDWGTLHTLPRRIGFANAARLFLQARVIGAQEAKEIGLADVVVDEGELQRTALELASDLGTRAPHAFAETKRLMRELAGSLDEALEAELDAQEVCFTSPEFREGLAAFREKRPPAFRRG